MMMFDTYGDHHTNKMLKLSTWLTTLALVTLHTHSVVIKVENLPERCDYSKCTTPDPDPNIINVHLIPHTHDDVGWLKTVDQYYYGNRISVQKAGVQYILDTVVEELIRNKDRRFIYVETAFFWKWWLEQDDEQRAIVKELVRTGQLEFANGGWSMPDEAVTHYTSIIDQTTWGLRRLNDTFGRCGVPKTTWQIDTFGHSREIASLFAQMNYDAVYFAREDSQDHAVRKTHKTMEHVWQGSDDLGKAADLFTGLMDRHYSPPNYYNWDMAHGGDRDEPIIDNRESEEYNVDARVNQFVEYTKQFARGYATNNIFFPMGDDFDYMDAHIWFKNMDKLIQHVNEAKKGVKVFYSTPSCYTKALHDTKHRFTSKTDDFMPLSDNPHNYWTGFYTSRPALKRMERVGNNLLQACKQIDVLARNGGKWDDMITVLREAMGVLQHHDAVTGTERDDVAKDYARLLYKGFASCQAVIQASISAISKRVGVSNPPQYVFCEHLNVSACEITESAKNVAVTLYNPLGHDVVGRVIRIPVRAGPSPHYEVRDPNDKIVSSTLMEIGEHVRKVPDRVSNADHELLFRVDIPALGLATYKILTRENVSATTATWAAKNKFTQDETQIKSKNFDVVFDKSGNLVALITHQDNHRVSFRNQFRYYQDGQSNAYIFRPTSGTKEAGHVIDYWHLSDEKTGVHEVHQKFDSYLEQVIRIDPQREDIEVEFVVGPLPDDRNREVITLYETDLKNGGHFYTDANGRQMMHRLVNHRDDFDIKVEEPITSNYYPVTSRIALRDEKKSLQLTVMTDRSQGGTSVKEGAIELMLHRRLPHDDMTGPQKGLVIRARHLITLSKFNQAARLHRSISQQLLMEPIPAFFTLEGDQLPAKTPTLYKGLAQALPPQVNLLSLEQWNEGRYLLRLEHIYSRDEDAELSKPVTVGIKNLFESFEIDSVRELTLGANQDIEATKSRLTFDYTPVGKQYEPPTTQPVDPAKLEVTLNPMQIRTFVVYTKST